MPGMTSLGIRYPYQSEPVDAQSWQDMADDIEGLLTSLDTLRDLAVSKESAAISGGNTITATGADSFLSNFNVEEWDTGGFANLGVNSDRFTIPPGVYWAQIAVNLTGYATLTMARTGLLVAGTLNTAVNIDTTNLAVQANASGIIVATAATTVIQARVRWNGTGGPVTWSDGQMRIYKIRPIVDYI